MADYPLQAKFFRWGLFVGLTATVLFMDLLAGFSLLVFFCVLGVLWRRSEPPVLGVILSLQWITAVTGHFFNLIYGFYPAHTWVPGSIERATFLTLLSYPVVAGGIRSGFFFMGENFVLAHRRLLTSQPRYSVKRLFWYVIALYTVNWYVEILPTDIYFNAAEFISNALEFRRVILCLLWIVIARQREGYRYGGAAFVYVLAPEFIQGQARFVEVFVSLLLVIVSEWQPGAKSVQDRRRNARVALTTSGVVGVLFITVFGWQESVKSAWRDEIRSGGVIGTPVEKLGLFVSTAGKAVSTSDWGASGGYLPGESLAERLWATWGFAHVLERVPDVVPHENGDLTLRALIHSVTPRILFPEKPILRSNSWQVRLYAGLEVAGEELETSVGLGYTAGFYIDFGTIGMFLAFFVWGVVLSLVYGLLLLFSPSQPIFSAMIIPMILALQGDAEFSFMLGGITNRLIVFGGLLYVLGPWLHRNLLVRAGKENLPRPSEGTSTLLELQHAGKSAIGRT